MRQRRVLTRMERDAGALAWAVGGVSWKAYEEFYTRVYKG